VIAVPAVFVATLIGVTVFDTTLVTYAVVPAQALDALTPSIANAVTEANVIRRPLLLHPVVRLNMVRPLR
jgi:hypothetical protein